MFDYILTNTQQGNIWTSCTNVNHFFPHSQ